MGRKRTPGLVKRQELWHIDKRIGGRRVCQSTGAASKEEAELFLARQIDETRQAQFYGVLLARPFELAAAKFVRENQHKRTIRSDISQLKRLMPWIGSVPLSRIYIGTMQPWVERRRKEGVAPVRCSRDEPLIRINQLLIHTRLSLPPYPLRCTPVRVRNTPRHLRLRLACHSLSVRNISRIVNPVEFRGPVRPVPSFLTRWRQQVESLDLFAEVSLVQSRAENAFMYSLQF